MNYAATDFDVAVIGAGMSALTCARQLQHAGYRVVILEKSRGVGGRVATRRLHGTLADHGTCYLTPKGEAFRSLLLPMIATGVLTVWTDTVHELGADGTLHAADANPRFIAPDGMTAIAKFLAHDLDIRLSHVVKTIAQGDDGHWQVTCQHTAPDQTMTTVTLSAGAIVVAIPAPQAVMLLQTLPVGVLPDAFLQQVQSVTFTPCLSVIAGYAVDRRQEWLSQYPNVCSVTFTKDGNLAWLGDDSSKRKDAPQPVFVVQSTAAFAEQYLDAISLQSAGYTLLKRAAERLQAAWLATPDWLQVHRWRYAFARSPLADPDLSAETAAPLVCAGDWCGGQKVEQAFLSGLAAAASIDRQLQAQAK